MAAASNVIMKPILPATLAFDYWTVNKDKNVVLHCLMPNGLIIQIPTDKTATFAQFKEELWDESHIKYPLHHLLRDSSSYRFVFTNGKGQREELFDEQKRICDAQPFAATVKIILVENDKAECAFNTHIGRLIGKDLKEFDSLKNTEVNIFRAKVKRLLDEIVQQRKSFSRSEKIRFQFAPNLIITPVEDQIVSVHSPLSRKLRDTKFTICIAFEKDDVVFTFQVSINDTPNNLLRLIINKRAISLGKVNETVEKFILKVCGREEYIYNDHKLIDFHSIYEALCRSKQNPLLIAMNSLSVPLHPKENIYAVVEDVEPIRTNSSCASLRKKEKPIPSFTITDNFGFVINTFTNLNVDESTEVGVKAGIFHGGKLLCQPLEKMDFSVDSEKRCTTKGFEMVFDIKVADIPRMARLCFCVFEVFKATKKWNSKRSRNTQLDYSINPIGWVNTTVFDYRGFLRTGSLTLYLWSMAEDFQNYNTFQSLNTLVSNPDSKNTTGLSLTFRKLREATITYPDLNYILGFAIKYGRVDIDESVEESDESKLLLERARNSVDSGTFYEFHELEKKKLWSLRYKILRDDPELLLKLLNCVNWNNHFQVSEVVSLLQEWPSLLPQKAIELLDYAYASKAVRSYAVRCLKTFPDNHLHLYLLQLVQALKHECYLQNDLVDFLLMRALNNEKIGHYLFWHLRSEMNEKSVSVRFGLILEAYCRASPEHVMVLSKQLNFLEKLKSTNETLKERKEKEKNKMQNFIQEHFQQERCKDIFYLVSNPLDPSYKMKRIQAHKCRVMDSKAKPMWLVFENVDPYGSDINIIFKNGDDLRQDMLTIQMIKIMDNLWKTHGFDFRMTPYGCISTDGKVGLIEVVLDSNTIANIQKERGFTAAMGIRKDALLSWLKEHNKTERDLSQAIEEFTYSCAGYCVATFVLGIADRHSDNIMLKKTGQLFHIDFGHILGHFKEKFGIKRERVPFVLTYDFVNVITNGAKGDAEDSAEFMKFRRLCLDAFMILRKHGTLILSLFAMMISTGLPELSNESDLNYLRESLVLQKTESEAEEYFQAKFTEALKQSWKTSLNWASHNVSKNNK